MAKYSYDDNTSSKNNDIFIFHSSITAYSHGCAGLLVLDNRAT